MKITGNQWVEIIRAISTAIIAIITTLCVQSCTMSLSVSKNNQNSTSDKLVTEYVGFTMFSCSVLRTLKTLSVNIFSNSGTIIFISSETPILFRSIA